MAYPTLHCERCDYATEPNQHQVFLARHIKDEHNAPTSVAIAEARRIADEAAAGRATTARIAAPGYSKLPAQRLDDAARVTEEP